MALAGYSERKSNVDKIRSYFVNLALTLALILSFLISTPAIVHAQNPLQPTVISIGAPAQAPLGEMMTVQAVLADGQSHPISKEVISFTTQVTFLGKTSDVVLAQAETNANGQAVAQFVNDLSGTFQLRAEFQGDTQYSPSSATAQVETQGNQQVYIDHIGVDIPGFNVPPFIASGQIPQQGFTKFLQSLWPAMNGWPVAAVLFLTWFMYLMAVRYVLRVAKMGGELEKTVSLTTSEPGRSK